MNTLLMASSSQLHRVCEVLADWLRGPRARDPGLGEDDWPALVAAARVHGLGPRLAPVLDGASWIPPDVASWIADEAELNRQRVELMCREGAEILDAAAGRGIDVLPLKGLALAAWLPEIRHRPMADLDLLVRPDHAAALRDLLRDLGYPDMVHKAKHDEYLRASGRRIATLEHEHPDNPRPVDVHRRCGESFARSPVDLTDLVWSSQVEATIGGVTAVVPRIETIWAHLVVHTAWQWWFGGGRMVQLLDLVELAPSVRSPETALTAIDPRFALLALDPAERLLPDRLPRDLVEDLRHRAGRPAARLAADLDPVNSSHLAPHARSLLMRILRLHGGRPRSLIRGAGYVFAPGVDEMLINHDRVPAGAARIVAYPGLWLWHVVNLVGRA
jgi:hypothetical protein